MKGATVADFTERLVVNQTPSIFVDSPQRFTISAASDIGTLKVNMLIGRSFSLCQNELNLKYNTIIEANDHPIDKIGFYMLDRGCGGAAAFGDPSPPSEGRVAGGESYVAFNPSLKELHYFEAQCTKPLYLEVDASYFTSLMDDNDKFTGKLKEKIGRREFFGLKTSFSTAIGRVVSSIYDCPIEGPLGNLFIEGSLQQFIALQLAPFMQPVLKNENMTSRDKDILHAVKEYLHKTFQMNHSLIDLSRHFGINQNKLKKSFKELFGVPVIEYLYNLKMEHARIMLYDQGMYVGEVASIVGYKNANHFSTAFKRKFGVTPSRI